MRTAARDLKPGDYVELDGKPVRIQSAQYAKNHFVGGPGLKAALAVELTLAGQTMLVHPEKHLQKTRVN